MEMKEIMLKRTKKFTIDCAILCSKLPKTREYNAYVNQLIRFLVLLEQIIDPHKEPNQQSILLIN